MRIFLIIMLFLTTPAYSDFFVSSQTGGYIGSKTLGLGYNSGKASIEYIFGYVSNNKYQLALKSTYRFYRYKRISSYIGSTIIHIPKDRLFKEYPSGYYPPIYLTSPNAGLVYSKNNYNLFIERDLLYHYTFPFGYYKVDSGTYSIGISYPLNY